MSKRRPQAEDREDRWEDELPADTADTDPERSRKLRRDRLTDLAEAIRSGQYRVPEGDVADAIIRFFAREPDAGE